MVGSVALACAAQGIVRSLAGPLAPASERGKLRWLIRRMLGMIATSWARKVRAGGERYLLSGGIRSPSRDRRSHAPLRATTVLSFPHGSCQISISLKPAAARISRTGWAWVWPISKATTPSGARNPGAASRFPITS